MSRRITLMRPPATKTSDTTRSFASASGVSFFGGGKLTRAMVADVHPIHHPPHTSRSALRPSESSRRRETARMPAHTAAQPMLYVV
ncbi:MAG TPA: hypothetical protein VHX88_21335 [Solirubrobacteraceae bacterium]|nr:hypothetical protein [Solirubrobacteraceae bacterium]